jgi:mannitol-1-phosphate/altronate dehydrogenase
MGKKTVTDFQTFKSEVVDFMDFLENKIAFVDKMIDRVDSKMDSINEKHNKPPKQVN